MRYKLIAFVFFLFDLDSSTEEVFYTTEPQSRANRRRRAVKRTVELMVVVDAEMQRFHGDDTKRYVMTAVNIVSLLKVTEGYFRSRKLL